MNAKPANRRDSAIIAFRGVTKTFGATIAVDDLSFAVTEGETVAVLGPSGCGKTTTLRLIAGFEEPDSGTIEIDGQSMRGRRPYERNVGLLFQHYALFPHMTVAENVGYGLKYRNWPKTTIPARIREMLALVQLEGYESRRPGQLSGGQQQRVALARVLATSPKLILLDEPLSALDAKLREELRIELKQILSAVGSTNIVVTHDQNEAMSLADRIVVMNRGRIEQQGLPDDVYARPQTRFVADFIGQMNWFHGQCADVAGQPCATLVTDAGTRIALASPAGPGRLSIGVRPERIIMWEKGDTACDSNLLSGTIAEVVNMGAALHYLVDGVDGRIIVVEPNRSGVRVRAGDLVQYFFQPRDCIVMAEPSR